MARISYWGWQYSFHSIPLLLTNINPMFALVPADIELNGMDIPAWHWVFASSREVNNREHMMVFYGPLDMTTKDLAGLNMAPKKSLTTSLVLKSLLYQQTWAMTSPGLTCFLLGFGSVSLYFWRPSVIVLKMYFVIKLFHQRSALLHHKQRIVL